MFDIYLTSRLHFLYYIVSEYNQTGESMDAEALLPPHGRVSCNACFGGQTTWGKSILASSDGWTLENNPCAWGARNPLYLVLGFSKGERQSTGILNKQHDDIPFAGFRPRLTAGLQRLGLLTATQTIESHLRRDERDWAFGSVVRCTLAENGKKSGVIISSSAKAKTYAEWRDQCTHLYLSTLPSRLRVVVMLSNADPYIESCRQRIERLHPETRIINPVSYGDSQVTWVHIVHFGGQAFNHMRDWLAFSDNKAGRKGRWAMQAVQEALAR